MSCFAQFQKPRSDIPLHDVVVVVVAVADVPFVVAVVVVVVVVVGVPDISKSIKSKRRGQQAES